MRETSLMIRETLGFIFAPWRTADRFSQALGFTTLAVIALAIGIQFWGFLVPVMVGMLILLTILTATNLARAEIRGRRAALEFSRECERITLAHRLLRGEVDLEDLSPEARADIMPLYTKYKLDRS